MNPHRYLPLNPSSVRSRFAKRFLLALSKINGKLASSRSPRDTAQRYLRVKAAADRSLARAVGPRRAWSRALLYRIRGRALRRRRNTTSSLVFGRRRRGINDLPLVVANSRNIIRDNSGSHVEKGVGDGRGGGEVVDFLGQADELRKLVPGGEAMDTCRLLGEALHYMQCLKTQVQVMRCIADYYSSST